MNRSKNLRLGERYNFERIAELRKDKCLKQSEIAELLNMSQRNYSHIESGEYDISGYELRVLACLFETSSDYLLGLTDERHPYKPSKNYKVTIKEAPVE